METLEQCSPISIAVSYFDVLYHLRLVLEGEYGGFSDCSIQDEERNFQSIVEFLFLLFSINPELIKNIDFGSESELDASQKLLQTVIDMYTSSQVGNSANLLARNQISERNPSIQIVKRKIIRSLLYNYKIKLNDSELSIAEIISFYLEVDPSDALKSSPAILLILEIFRRHRNLQNIFNL